MSVALSSLTTKVATAQGVTHIWGARLDPNGKDDWIRYRLGNRIGKGGMASVHEIYPEYMDPIVAKLFDDEMLARIKGDPKIAMRLAALVRNRAKIGKELKFATWPRRMLFSKERPNGKREIADSVIGFTMRKLQNTVSLQDLMMDPERRLRLTPEDTAYITTTLADQIHNLHKHEWGFVFGDLSPNNVHVGTDFRSVSFIDTDSFQFDFEASKYSFTLGGITKGYKSPGVDEQLRKTGRVTAAHDDFVLAILIFQLLMMDRQVPRHPFQYADTPLDVMIAKRAFPFDTPHTYRVPPSCLNAYATFPPAIRQAFSRTFTTSTPVSAAEWTMILSDYRRSLRPR